MIALAKKTKPPVSMNIFLLNFLVTHDAPNDATSAAKYREDVNMVSVTLSNLQYYLANLSKLLMINRWKKNFYKKEAMDVTPPIYTYTKSYVRIKLNTSTYMYGAYVKEELIMEKRNI